MPRFAGLAALLVALVLFGARPVEAASSQKCIFVYWPRVFSVCPGPDDCSYCPAGQIGWTAGLTRIGCEDGAIDPQECSIPPNGNDANTWWHQVYQGLPTQCNNPVSGAYSECQQAPTPNTCDDAENHLSSCVGDPVDLTTGRLEYSATDVDLGGGFVFSRFYGEDLATNSDRSLGKLWRHSLDWRLTHHAISPVNSNDPAVGVVAVSRPFSNTVVFQRAWYPPFNGTPAWTTSSVDAAGALTGTPNDGFIYLDHDGSRVKFEAEDDAFSLVEVQPPGQPAISVSQAGNSTTFARGSSTLVVSRDAQDRVSSVVSDGKTWGYGYDSGNCLKTVSGWNPADASEPVAWTYTYAFLNGSAGCGNPPALAKIERQVASGPVVAIASWEHQGLAGRVSSIDEPAVDQKLYLTYGSSSSTLTVSVRDEPNSPTALATYTSQDRRVVSVSGLGGPGIEVPISAATFTSAGPALPSTSWKSIADPNGIKTLFENHDSRGRPGRITEGWKDENGNDLIDGTDTYARRRDYLYHPSLDTPIEIVEQSSITGAFDRVSSHVYDHPDNPEQLHRTRLSGKTLSAAGLVVGFLDETVYEYNPSGLLRSIAGPRAEQLTEIDHDAAGRRIAIRRFENRQDLSLGYLEWTFTDFDARGNPQTVRDPNWSVENPGRGVTRFTYDALSRVRSVRPPYPEGQGSVPPGDPTIGFTYDIDGNLTRIQFPPDALAQPVFLRMGYDPKGNLTFITDSDANAIVYTYEKGRVNREARYREFVDLGAPGILVEDATFDYTTSSQSTAPIGRLLHAFNPLFESGAVYSRFGHDRKGRLTSIRDENGKEDLLLYDALDRLEKISQVRTATYETRFEYDALSNVTEVTDAGGRSTELLHDDRGNLVEVVSPDTGRTRYVYDEAGNLTQRVENAPPTGPGGRITYYSHDGLNRLVGIDLPTDPGVLDWEFIYDAGASLNRMGRLSTIERNGAVATSLGYTARGDVAFETTTIAGLSYTVSYEYDAAGNRTSILTPDATQVITQYSGLRPASISVGGVSQQLREIHWHPFGPWIHAEFPKYDAATGQNTVVSHRDVNLRGQITRVHVTNGTASILDRSYSHDRDGDGTVMPKDPGPNLDEVVDTIDPSETQRLFYDSLDRLARTTDSTGVVQNQYGYDAVGNLLTKQGVLGSTNYAYEVLGTGTNNRLDGATGGEARDYLHDAYGNRIFDGATGYAGTPTLLYDDSNRLIHVKDSFSPFNLRASYDYDAFGRRVHKIDWVRNKEFVYVYDTEGHLLQEVEKRPNATDLNRTYVYLEDDLVGTIDRLQEAGVAGSWQWIPFPTPKSTQTLPTFVVVLVGAALLLILGRRSPAGSAAVTAATLAVFTCAGTNRPPPVFSWVHTDPLGTPLAVTDAPEYEASAVIWRAKYEPFGKATVSGDPDGDGNSFELNVRFPGQYEDWETGWHYNLYRTYDPSTGRYIEPDPLGPAAGLNLYAYVEGNPTNWADPFGLDLWICDRPTHGPMPGNHSYLWNPATGENEGRGGGASGGGEGQSAEDPRGKDDACGPIPGTEGKEDEILDDLNMTANRGPWIPFINDCHNSINRTLKRQSMTPLPSPNGRFGRSNRGAQKP